jgi:hypothetical protein
MTIKARIRWTDGYQFVARAGDGPAVNDGRTESILHRNQERASIIGWDEL